MAARQNRLRPGQELILTKWVALSGTAALAKAYEEELRSRYPLLMIDRALEFEKLMSVASEARAISHFGPAAMHDLSQGGVFGALWEMADYAEVGLEVDLKKIPIRQETIEICEYFDVNPYELYSAGSLLVGVEHAGAVIEELARLSIPAVVIGRVTDGNDRLVRNGEDCRYLDRPKQDEWYRLAAAGK
jgi:hydrogenase maturation factor